MDASTPLASASTTTKGSTDLSISDTSLVTIYNKQTDERKRLDETFVRCYGVWATELDNWNKSECKVVNYTGSSKMLDCLTDLVQYRYVGAQYDLETIKKEVDRLFIVYEQEDLLLVPNRDTSIFSSWECVLGVKDPKAGKNIWIFAREFHVSGKFLLVRARYTNFRCKGGPCMFIDTLTHKFMTTRVLTSGSHGIAVDLDRKRVVWLEAEVNDVSKLLDTKYEML